MNTRQQIIDALEAALKEISSVKTVSVWKLTEFAPAEYPVIIIKDTTDTMPGDGVIGKIDHELSVDIECRFFGGTSDESAREMVASIMAKIGEDYTLGGLGYDFMIQTATLEGDDTGKLISSITIETLISYRSDLWTI